MKRINEIMSYIDEHALYPDLRIVEGPQDPEVTVDGKKVVMFCSNNYLGLSTHPDLIKAACDATRKYGVGSGGSRLLSGNLDIHKKFETAIAEFEGGEDAISWATGYAANLGLISAIMNPLKVRPRDFFTIDGVIFSDELNHASIVDGIRLSKQKKVVYNHRDVKDLEYKLRKHPLRRKLVVTDSVFSMDGDIAPLDKIVPLCKKYGAMLLVDDAHATGVLGNNGHGSLEYFNLKLGRDVDVIMGTCSKSLTSTGGFAVGNKNLISYLRIASRSYMFSAAMTPATAAILIKALELMKNEPERHKQLVKNAEYLRFGLQQAGFNTLSSQTQIIPILIGTDENAIRFSRNLFEKNIYAPAVRWPAVEKGKARIRFALMASHKKEHLDALIKACIEVGKSLNIV